MRLIVVPASGSAPVIDQYLLPREQQYIAVRQHPAVLLGPVITVVAGLIVSLIFTEGVALPGRGAAGAVWVTWGLLLLYAVQKVISWSVNYFAVTSHRIMMVTGLGARKVGIIPLKLVNDLSYRRSFGGRALGYGEFLVQYGSQDQVLQRIQYIPYPEEFYLQIRELLPPADEAPARDESDEAPAGDESDEAPAGDEPES